MSRLKKLASETAIYGISSILGRAINVMIVPFYAHYFSEQDNGIINVLFPAFVWLNILYTYGLESAYMKFASGKEGRANANMVFSTATLMLFVTSSLFSILMAAFPEGVAKGIGLSIEWKSLVFYMAGIVLLDTMAALPMAELRLANRPKLFAAARLGNILINLGLNLYFIAYLKMGVASVFLANLISSGALVLFLTSTYVSRFRFEFSTDLAKTLLKYGLPLLPNGLAFAATETVNRWFLMRMSPEQVKALYGAFIPAHKMATLVSPADFGEYVNGVFGNVYKIGVFMMLFTQMFRFAWQPFYFQHARDADAPELFSRIFTLFTAIGLVIWLTVSFFAYEIVSFPLPGGRHLLPPTYWFVLSIVPIILFAYLFQGWDSIFSAGLYIEKKTSSLIKNTLMGALVTVVFNFLFVPSYGVLAASWGTFAAYAVISISLLFTVQKVYPVPYKWGAVLSMMGIAVSIFLTWNYFTFLQYWFFEVLLIAGFIGSLFTLGIVPVSTVKRLLKRGS